MPIMAVVLLKNITVKLIMRQLGILSIVQKWGLFHTQDRNLRLVKGKSVRKVDEVHDRRDECESIYGDFLSGHRGEQEAAHCHEHYN